MAIERSPRQAQAWRPIRRVSMLVVHSNPLLEPGAGDAGGMTVYVRQVAAALASESVQVDIFTRRTQRSAPPVTQLSNGVRVIQIVSGSPSLTKEEIADHLPEFASGVADWVEQNGCTYDLIHSHYWLSGKAASVLARRWEIPFIHTFHTLGRAKNAKRRPGEPEEPLGRLRGEAKVIAEASCIVASTPAEKQWLTDLYAAHPERIEVIHPGVDHLVFTPGDRDLSREKLGLRGKKVILFAGRLQPLKAPDDAIKTFALLQASGRLAEGEGELVVVGGSSGTAGWTTGDLRSLAASLGVESSVRFFDAQPHESMPDFFRAADVVLVPSRSETFGLVALEAQACGVPVVGSAVGGLPSIVEHSRTGFLLEPGDVRAYAERIWRILSDDALASNMRRLAICSSDGFSWERSASELKSLYVAARDGESTRI